MKSEKGHNSSSNPLFSIPEMVSNDEITHRKIRAMYMQVLINCGERKKGYIS